MSRPNPVCVRTGVFPAATSTNSYHGDDDVAAVEAEDLARDREVERQRPLVDHRRDTVHDRDLATPALGTH